MFVKKKFDKNKNECETFIRWKNHKESPCTYKQTKHTQKKNPTKCVR